MTSPADPIVSPPQSRSRGWIPVAILLALVASVLAWWFGTERGASAAELAAKAELTQLGALTVMDAARNHVNSVNLTTLKSPDTLDRAIELLADLPRLRSLHVEGTAFGDEHAEAVGRLSSLQDLSLSSTQITDAALDKLQGLSRLDTLYLIDTNVTNAGMPALAQIRPLKIISLSGTKVTGNFEPLRELPNLQHLDLQHLNLDAAALAAIAEFPALTHLTLRESTYPAEALAQLKDKKANLVID